METAAAVFSLMRVSFSYWLLFILLPLAALRWDADDRQQGTLHRLFVALIHANLFFIAAVHVLILLRLYETLSLYVVIVAAVFALRRYYALRSGRVRAKGSVIAEMLDAADNGGRWREAARLRAADLRGRCGEGLRTAARAYMRHPALWTALGAVMAAGLLLRLKHAFSHRYFAAADPYVHMQWAKLLTDNVIYSDGVYPYGFEAVLSSLSRVFILDMYPVVRFFGPLTSFFIMLSMVYFMRRLGRRDLHTALLALAIYALGSGLPVNEWRQMSALSMEYGAIFLLPGIWLLGRYFTGGGAKYVLLAGETLLLTLLIHPYAAFCLGIAYVVLACMYAETWIRSAKQLLKLAGVMAAAGVLGLLPLGIGLLSGKSFHTMSLNYVKDTIAGGGETSGGSWFEKMLAYMQANPVYVLFFICVLLAGVAALWARELPRRGIIALAGTAVILFVTMRAPDFGLPTLVPEDRIGVFFAILAAAVMALPLRLLTPGRLPPHFLKAGKSAALGALLIVLTVYGRYQFPIGDRYQYDEAVAALEAIKDDYFYKEWTIISPGEELPLINGYGVHAVLWEFVQALSEPEAVKPVVFDTPYVFVFVEKIPLTSEKLDKPLGGAVTEAAAAKPFPALQGDPTEFYYRDPERRTLLEAKLYVWAEAYLKQHSNMDIYFENDHFKVYRIANDGASSLIQSR